jgi:hypothetical protein
MGYVMKWFLRLLVFVVLPISMQADEKSRNIFNQPAPTTGRNVVNLHFDQMTLIRLSEFHYAEAVVELNKANGICWYIPNLEKRRHFEALIFGAITAANAKGGVQKLLLTGLTLIADLIVTSMQQYNELQAHLVKAQYHFEAADFYNTLSANRRKHKDTDEGTRIFLDGIDYLTYSIVILEGIHPSFDCILKDSSIVYTLMSYRNDFLDNQRNIAERGHGLYENIYEIMADCKHDFKHTIGENIGIMASKFKQAEDAWKQKKKK